MTELDKIKLAKSYIDKMAEGTDPLTGKRTEDSDMINNVRISRCLFYVSDILRQVIENNGTVQRKAERSKKRFFITDEQRAMLSVSDKGCYVRDIAEEINRVTAQNETRRIQPAWITSWLVEAGMLEVVNGKKQATKQGNDLGISSESRYSSNIGYYLATVYAPSAQAFIFDNLDAIVNMHYSSQADKGVNFHIEPPS